MDKLLQARKEIDEIDAQMAELFCRRMNASAEVAKYKQENGLAVFDEKREQEVIEKNALRVESETLKSYYISYIKNLMNLSKNYQHFLLEGMKIAYNGVPGAFGYIAAEKIFPDGLPVSYGDFAAAYAAVENGDCDCAVLPIENSYAGDVTQVMDLMFFGSLHVSGIYDLEVVQNLVGTKDATIADVRKVISHPQALGQCAEYLKLHGYEICEATNTAVAAKSVAQNNDKSVAAIASESAAGLYGLRVLEKAINKSGTNTTRFAVFTRAKPVNTENDNHFVMFFTVNNEAGSLGKAVSIIGEHGFNLQALKSRPTKDLNWEYYFYVEGRGNIGGENGQIMVSRLSKVCRSVKVAGSFGREIKLSV